MTTVLSTPASLVNNALGRTGYKKRIGNLLDGSEAAKKALDLFGQTRDDLLRAGNWQFARRDLQMVLLKEAPADYVSVPWTLIYPPPPWRFEYEWPVDCLKVRNIKAQQSFVNFDPKNVNFSTYNDNDPTLDPTPRKTILCDVGPTAILTYTGQVVDPAQWETTFVEAFCAELGRRLAPALMGLDASKAAAADALFETQAAKQEAQG